MQKRVAEVQKRALLNGRLPSDVPLQLVNRALLKRVKAAVKRRRDVPPNRYMLVRVAQVKQRQVVLQVKMLQPAVFKEFKYQVSSHRRAPPKLKQFFQVVVKQVAV